MKRLLKITACVASLALAVSCMTQKLMLDADDARFAEIVRQAAKACKKVEPDCTIVL